MGGVLSDFSLFLIALCLFMSSLGLTLSVYAMIRSSGNYRNDKLRRKITGVEVELADLRDHFETLARNLKRMNARQAVRKNREQKKNGDMSDDEWRTWATRRIQQGLPVED